jgi:hypothetical protein
MRTGPKDTKACDGLCCSLGDNCDSLQYGSGGGPGPITGYICCAIPRHPFAILPLQ